MSVVEVQISWALFTALSLMLLASVIIGISYRATSTYKNIPGKGDNHCVPFLKWLVSVTAAGRISTQSVLRKLTVLFKIHRKNGVCLLNLPFLRVVFLYHPDVVKVLLGDTENNCRSIVYSFMEDWLSSSLLLRDGEEWKQRRKLLTPAFHFQILNNFLPVMQKHSKILIKRLKNHQEEEWVDVAPFVTRCVMDIICETSMGLEESNDHCDYYNYQKSLSAVCEIIQTRAWQPYLWPSCLFNLTRKRRELLKNVKVMKDVTEKIVERRLGRSDENKNEETLAFLDLLLDCLKRNSNFTIRDVCEEVQLFLFAGHDTTAITITWTLYLLGKHGDVQDKARREVDSVIGEDDSRQITKEDLQRMKYLEAVIKETLRIYPLVPILTRKLTKDVIIKNYKISEGSTCIIPVFFMHEDPKLFPNPKVFDPDRFLPENISKILPYSYIPFSAGPRNCIGQKFAMMEMKMVLANVIRYFSLRSLDESLPFSFRIVNHPEGEVRIKLTPRNGGRDDSSLDPLI